jgi:Tripartite tricarboxylate transporter family receptor
MLQKIIHSVFCLALYLSLGSAAHAENLRTYNMVIPWSAGSASDLLFRGMEPALNTRLANHQIRLIVENTPGAGGAIGLASIINSKNKLVFGLFSPFFAINKNTRTDYIYDYDSVNFLSFAGYNKMVVISGKHTSMKDLQSLCAKENSIIIGSSGVGSTTHLIAQYFAKKYLSCKTIVDVPYKGTSAAYPDLKAGRIDIMVDFSIGANPFIASNYFNKIEEIRETDLLAWHVLVSSISNNPDAEIVRREFDALKKDKSFVDMIEANFYISRFAESKDINWLKNEFANYKKVIDSVPQIPKN